MAQAARIHEPVCQLTSPQEGGGRVNDLGSVFLGYSRNTTGNIPQRKDYLSIVADEVHPVKASVLIQMVAFSRTMHSVRIHHWFQEHDSEFQLLQWPAQSHDLNQAFLERIIPQAFLERIGISI